MSREAGAGSNPAPATTALTTRLRSSAGRAPGFEPGRRGSTPLGGSRQESGTSSIPTRTRLPATVSGLDDILGGLTGRKGGSGGLDDVLGGLLGGGRGGGGGGGGSAMGALLPVLAGLLASGGLSKILGSL